MRLGSLSRIQPRMARREGLRACGDARRFLRKGESGEDYKARLMESMREARESCTEALRIRDERVAEKIKAEAVAWDSVHVDDKGRVKLSRKAAMEERKAEFSDDEEGGSPDSGDASEE